MPGERLFFGWPCLVLAGVSLVLPRSRIPASIEGDPRWVLLAGLLLVAAVAAGPSLGTGLAALRFSRPLEPGWAPSCRASTTCATRASWRSGPIWRPASWPGSAARRCCACGAGAGPPCLGLLAIALVWVDTLRPAALGFDPPVAREMFRLAPDPEALAFFETLAEKGNTGPIFEMPLQRIGRGETGEAGALHLGRNRQPALPRRLPRAPDLRLLRRARPGPRPQLEEIALRLPRRDAIRALRGLGFTTIVFRHGVDSAVLEPDETPETARPACSKAACGWPPSSREASAPDGLLDLVHEMPGRSAYSIEAEPGTSESPTR